jgi:hypothetical protein
MADDFARRAQYEYKAVSRIIFLALNQRPFFRRTPILSYKSINL